MLDKIEFAKLINAMAEMFDKQLTESLVDMYYEILKNYSEERVKRAVIACIKSHKYNTLPKPASILEFLEESHEDRTLRAWLYVREAMQKADYYFSVNFKDKVIPHCIEALGGWMWLCDQAGKDMPFVERRFLDLYRIFSRRELQDSPLMIGFFESKNREDGYEKDTPKPIQIGYKQEELQLEHKPSGRE